MKYNRKRTEREHRIGKREFIHSKAWASNPGTCSRTVGFAARR